MIFYLFLFSIFLKEKKSENCDSLAWVFNENQYKPPQSNCFHFLNSIIINSHVSDNGGCIFVYNKEMEIVIYGSSFIHSTSEKVGGALFLDIKKSDISNCCIQNCSSKEMASSIYVKSIDHMADNLISSSAVTLCNCHKSTLEIIQGQQLIFLTIMPNPQVQEFILTHYIDRLLFYFSILLTT